MGVAHHSSYLLWFEIARTGLLREAGHAYRDLESDGVRLPVVEYGCKFMKSADYDDALRIERDAVRRCSNWRESPTPCASACRRTTGAR